MSTSSVNRLKERGGGGAKMAETKPSRTSTPVSDRFSSGGETIKKPAGKENLRSTSRVRAAAAAAAVSQKPVMRAMPRMEKPSGDDSETRVRWSTSSVPRGRSSSPSDFNRVLSDSRRIRVSRVSVDRCEKGLGGEIERSGSGRIGVSEKVQLKRANFRDSNVKSNEGIENGIRVLKDCKDSERSSEKFRVRVLDERTGNANLSLISTKPCLKSCNEVTDSVPNVKVSDDDVGVIEESKRRSFVVSRSDDVVEKKPINNLSLKNAVLKEKGVNEVGVGAQSVNKYPSKLHEKLAFLEGKVKRIASDIKRTKEMLDMNNPDASKVILSDIHEKISGIEKAMGGHVVNSSDGNVGVLNGAKTDDSRIKMTESAQSSVKGMNSEELEARLFPHHKLIRDRASLMVSSKSSKSCQLNIMEATSEVKPEEKVSSPIDENPIALEFLASLSKDKSKVTLKDVHGALQPCEIEEMDDAATSEANNSSNLFNRKGDVELILTTDETLDEFEDQENQQPVMIEEETEDGTIYQLNEIGLKTSTGGWFVSEGESVLLAHNDSSCSFYDIANSEEKSEYRPPTGVSPNVWRDCWIIRAPSADGCTGRYVVAASAGNTADSGFCSWDFYTKDVRAFHIEDGIASSRTALAPLPNNTSYTRNALPNIVAPENQQWWYKPCGPLIACTASCQRVVKIYDIRDGEHVMQWEVQKPVLAMDYSSPLQWRNRGKLVLAEAETISLWDVSSLNTQALLSVSSGGRKISALHVNNTDAEIGGGVRQRVSSSEAEGNDGVFCTTDSINVLDFRHPSGIGLKIPKLGLSVQSVFSRGDSIFLGCTNSRSAGKKQYCSQVQNFSIRKQRLVSTYALPESNAHLHYAAITQVWGNSNLIMGVCGLGLFVFDALNDDGFQSFTMDYGNKQNVREIIGPDDLYSPSFDYMASRVLLISRDRPAQWRYLS